MTLALSHSLLLDKPEVYNLPEAPTLPETRTPRGSVMGIVTLVLLGVPAAARFLLGTRGEIERERGDR